QLPIRKLAVVVFAPNFRYLKFLFYIPDFNANFYVSHPDIYRFTEVMKYIQLNTYIKINSVDLSVSYKNLKYKKGVECNNNLVRLYKNKFINRFNFVKCISYQYAKK